MIRAAALSYAIVFVLVVGMLCSSILIISSAQKKVEIHFTSQEHVLFDSYAAIQFGKNELENNESIQLIHPSNDTSNISKKSWGFFSILQTITFNKHAKKIRHALCFESSKDRHPSIYLPGNYGGLKIAGETFLEGKSIIPNASLELTYLPNTNRTLKELIKGETEKADLYLPALKKEFQNLDVKSIYANLKPIPFFNKDTAVAFNDKTLYIRSLDGLILNKKYSGNIVFQSFDSIYITSKSHIENCILIAPKVVFEEGFTGSVQVFATNKIILQKNVHLTYPSFLFLNENANSLSDKNRIEVNEEAQIIGGILMTTQSFDQRNMMQLKTAEKSVVGGLIYCTGEAEIRGTVIGSIYTNRFYLDYGGSVYTNHLVNAFISSKKIPKQQVFPNWIQGDKIVKTEIMSWL